MSELLVAKIAQRIQIISRVLLAEQELEASADEGGPGPPSCTKVRLPAAQHWPMLNCSAMNAASAACTI